ncbi:MAG: CPBP family intramembrane metalloprotease [Bacteroidetes bacterium]|nr:CPBP family intramembrane metalloprotease [Bacteroidota bacterium]
MSEATFLKDGRLERAGLSPLLSAVLGLMAAFLLFQGISAVVLVGFTIMSGVALADLMTQTGLSDFLTEHADIVIWSNTIGQIFGLLLPGLWFARLHSSTVRSFLRLRRVPVGMVVLAVIGLLALIPLVQWTATLFDGLPWPQWIRDMEEGQMVLIEQVLMQDFSLLFTISMLALTPAICEEILFRGFVQRQAERRLGAWGGILFSGIIFGFYHLRLTQAIPLSLLGIFMAWLTWRTRSLWPAIIVHLLNNTFAAVLGKMASKEGSNIDVESFEFPILITALSALVLAAMVTLIHRIAVRTWPDEATTADSQAQDSA